MGRAWARMGTHGQKGCGAPTTLEPYPSRTAATLLPYGAVLWQNGCMVSMNSERFLSFALWRANVTVVHHQAWMY